MQEKKKSAKIDGVFANSLVIPLAIVLTLLYALIIILVYSVNSSTNRLSGMMEQFSACQHELTELQTGAGLMSETTTSFALMPVGEDGGSMAVCLFDVNFLKRTNDTKGHLAGDKLIQTTAACIRECFGNANENNCYRIGGDEFVAVLRSCEEDEIRTRIDHFLLALEREQISVSVGYAYAKESDEGSFRLLMGEADKQMYEQKKKAHGLEE